MTELELQKKLEQHSPFKMKGESQEVYTFKNGLLFVDGKESGKYLITKRADNSFDIHEPGALIPLWKNVKVSIDSEEGFPVVINHDIQALVHDSYRDKDAENGFFILESLNTDGK